MQRLMMSGDSPSKGRSEIDISMDVGQECEIKKAEKSRPSLDLEKKERLIILKRRN